MKSKLLLIFFCAFNLCCCGTGQGTVLITAYGESFIEEGIPATAFDDGWTVDFGRFAVSIGQVQVAGQDIPVQSSIDLTQSSSGTGHELGSALVDEGEYSDAGFTIYSVEVIGQASKDQCSKTFNWVFEQPIAYSQCETVTKVLDGTTSTLQITIHADHLFYDSLVAAEPQMLFQPLADADTNNDHTIQSSELSLKDIGAYDPGSEGSINDLWAWLTAQTSTLGHVDGEGHCQATAANN